jgi:hypothetical protein
MLLWLGEFVASGCFCFCAEGGGRVSARRPRYFFFASPKKSTQKKGDPAARVPTRPLGEWGSLRCSVLGCTAELAAFPLRENSARTTTVSQFTMRVSFGTRSPQALRFSARSEGGGNGLHSGHCFARHRGPSLRSARQGDGASFVGSAHRARPRPQAQLRSSSRVVPAPHPCWLRREAQELGWACVPKDTHASSSGLPQLSERSSKNAASSAAPPQDRASQVAPVRPTGRMGDADWGSPFLW